MTRAIVLAVAGTALVLAASACTSTARRTYDDGAVTPFARRAIDGATTVPVVATQETVDVAADYAAVTAHLDAVAKTWRDSAREAVVDPAALGFATSGDGTVEALREGVTAERLAAATYTLSPQIRAARESFRATVAQFDQVGYLDAILRQYTTFTKDLNLRFGAQRQKQTVESQFPFPNALALKSRIVEADAHAARERLRQTVREQLVAAGRAYYDYAYVHEAIAIVHENVELLRALADVAASKYGVGGGSQAAPLRAEVELAALQDRLVTLNEQETTTRARIAALLGQPAGFVLGPPGDIAPTAPPLNADALYAVARESRQELRATDDRIARTEALIELAETKAYPDVSLGYSRFENGTGTSVGGARMKEPFDDSPRQMPRPWFGQTASFIQEMRTRLGSMRAARDDLRARIDFQVKDAWFKWDAAWRQSRLHEESLLPQSAQAYQVLESGWREGVGEFLDTIDAERAWLRYRLSYRAAVRDTNIERLALLDALGTRLPASATEED